MLERYPHLSKADKRIWLDFIQVKPAFFHHPVFDLRVGLGPDIPEGIEEPWRSMALDLGRRRVDVFAWRDDQACLIEIKPKPGTTAIGQLITYKTLYFASNPIATDPRLYILCDRIDRDELAVCYASSIEVLCRGRHW